MLNASFIFFKFSVNFSFSSFNFDKEKFWIFFKSLNASLLFNTSIILFFSSNSLFAKSIKSLMLSSLDKIVLVFLLFNKYEFLI